LKAYQTKGIPRGIRNQNPLNLRKSSDRWQGLSPVQADAEFLSFVDAHHGIRAGARNLLTYHRKYKLCTVQGIVSRWAPPEDDNDTGAYVSSVCAALGVAAEDALDLENPSVLAALVTAMIRVECGSVPYDNETILTAVNAAYGGSNEAPPRPAPRPVPGVPAPAPSPSPAVAASDPVTGERPVPPLVDQPSSEPTRKVKAIPLGGLAGVPVAWVAKALWDKWMPETPMDAETAIFFASLASTGTAYLAAYFTRNRSPYPPPRPAYPDYPEY
jgi:hypothetical protein